MVSILVVMAVLQAVVDQLVAVDQQVNQQVDPEALGVVYLLVAVAGRTVQDLALLLALETALLVAVALELALEAAQLLQQQLLALLVAPAHNRWLALLPLQQRLQPQADQSAGANDLLYRQLVAMQRQWHRILLGMAPATVSITSFLP